MISLQTCTRAWLPAHQGYSTCSLPTIVMKSPDFQLGRFEFMHKSLLSEKTMAAPETYLEY